MKNILKAGNADCKKKKSVQFQDRNPGCARVKLAPLKCSIPTTKPVTPPKDSPAISRVPQNAEEKMDVAKKQAFPNTTDEHIFMRLSPTKRTMAAESFLLSSHASDFMLNRRRSTISLFSARETAEVLSRLAESKKTREQEQIGSKLQQIKKRVRKALEDVGLESEDEEDAEKNDHVKLPPIFDSKAERDRRQEQNFMLSRLDAFEEKAILRNQFLTELSFWFKENENLASDVVTPEEMKAMVASAQETHQNITEAIIKFMTNGDKVVELGKQLLDETGKIIAERNAQMAKKTKKERFIVYDDKVLLSDPIKWESSVRMVISVMEDCQKMIKNIMFKNALKLSHRQFDFLMVASDKRNKDLDEKKKQCLELNGKLHSAKTLTEKLNKEVDEQRRHASKITTELAETKDSLEKLKIRNMELNSKVKELMLRIKLLEEQLQEKLRTPTPPPPPSPTTPPEPEKIYLKVVDSSTQLRLQEVERELKKATEEIEKHQSNISTLMDKLVAEKGKNRQLIDRITELESVPEPVMPVNSPTVIETVVIQATVPEVKEKPPADKEASYYKTLMIGMKNEYETEMEKLKTFVKKEKSRGEAGVRKLEIQHKDYLNAIHKDTVRILRAIVHMRDHMLNVLHKENLPDQAQALADLGNLAKDKVNPEPKGLLTTVVGAVVDYLHNMETILNNSFLALRVMMKGQMDRYVEEEVQRRMAGEKQMMESKKVAKDCMKRRKALTGARKDVTGLAKKLKNAKNKLKKYNKDMDIFTGDQRYNDLLQRYGLVIKLYKNMQKEMDNLQSDFHDTMQRKLDEKETMVITKMEMEIKQQRIVKEEQLKMSLMDHRENLRLLSRAYEENKISRELHILATSMIKKTMEIPQRKLKNLFEQYITFRTVKESKRRVEEVLLDDDSELEIDTRREMEQYLEQLDGRFSDNMAKWRQKMKELDQEKKELNRNIYKLFNELLLETGILLVHPLLRDKNTHNIISHAATLVPRQQIKAIMAKKRNRFQGFMRMPDLIQGNAFSANDATIKRWAPSTLPPSEPKPGVISPHMLAYDINKPIIAAIRKLSTRRKTLFSLGKTESFNIGPYNHLEFLRNYNRVLR